MTIKESLEELLSSLAYGNSSEISLGWTTIQAWSPEATEFLRTHGLVRSAGQADQVECIRCERRCVRPVEVLNLPERKIGHIVVCEDNPEIGLVDIPEERLVMWVASQRGVARFVALLFEIKGGRVKEGARSGRWELGATLLGGRGAHAIDLNFGVPVSVIYRETAVPLVQFLSFTEDEITLDQRLAGSFLNASGPVDSEAKKGSEKVYRRETKKKITIEKYISLIEEAIGIYEATGKSKLACCEDTIKKAGVDMLASTLRTRWSDLRPSHTPRGLKKRKSPPNS